MSEVKTIKLSRRFADALDTVLSEGSVYLGEDFEFNGKWDEDEILRFRLEVLSPLCVAMTHGHSLTLEIDGSDNRDYYGEPYDRPETAL